MSWTFSIVLLLVVFITSSSHAHTHGTATVDIVTFDRILQHFDTVLVKFDRKHRMYLFTRERFHEIFFLAFGDKHEHFKRFAESASDTKELLILEVPVTDTGDKENEELAKKYRIESRDFPDYKLFLKDKSKPLSYPGSADKTEDDLRRFLTRYTSKNSFRVVMLAMEFFSGIWVGLPGTLENLDYLARDIFDATSNHDRKGQKILLKKAHEEADKIVEEKVQKEFVFINETFHFVHSLLSLSLSL